MIRIRFYSYVAAMLLCAALLSGDEHGTRETAGDYAVAYVESFMDGRLTEAYGMLARYERDGVTFPQYESYVRATFPTADRVAPIRDSFPSLYALVIENLYRVSTVYIEELDASYSVNVELSTIDLLTVAFEISQAYPDVNSGEISDSDIDDIYSTAIAELYTDRLPPRTEIQVSIGVVWEDGNPVVLPGIRESFDRMRAGELSGQAWEARFDGRTEYAAALYEEAAKLDPDNASYRQELASLNTRLETMRETIAREASDYVREFISIETSAADVTGFPVIVCSIRNSGNQDVERLEFRIIYLDEQGLLMNVETGIHDFFAEKLGAGELLRDIRINTYESPFDWNGSKFTIEVLRHNP